jgi:hypothetical protein
MSAAVKLEYMLLRDDIHAMLEAHNRFAAIWEIYSNSFIDFVYYVEHHYIVEIVRDNENVYLVEGSTCMPEFLRPVGKSEP